MNITLTRVGDYYEVFDDEARVVARVLGLTLTKQHGRTCTGFPFYRFDHIDALTKAGFHVEVKQ